jgi:hypothetical protein
MHVRILAGEIVELVGLGGVSSAGKNNGFRLSFKKGKNQLVADAPVGSRD